MSTYLVAEEAFQRLSAKLKARAAQSEPHAKMILNTITDCIDEIFGGTQEACRPCPHCMITRCERAPLVWLRRGQSQQTENGFFTVTLDGWYCPKCGGSYGPTPKPK